MDSASTAQEPVSCTPELLHLLRRDPEDLREFLETVRAPDLAEALRDVEPDLAAEVVGLLPFERAVELFDEPELRESRAAIVERMPPEAVGPLVNAMSADQQADLFRELPQKERERLLGLVNQYTRSAISTVQLPASIHAWSSGTSPASIIASPTAPPSVCPYDAALM